MQGITVTLEQLLLLRHAAHQLHLSQTYTQNASQGNYASPMRGRGMDFVETRIYQPGDDIRTINWRVTARTGKPHTKLYQQERDRPIYLVLDFNPSMFFGTRRAFKSVVAAEVAALIAWAAVKNKDRVGALLMKEDVQLIPASRQKQTIISLLQKIAAFVVPSEFMPTNSLRGLTKLKSMIKSGSMIYIISDFYQCEDNFKKELAMLSRHHEVTTILIYDHLEKNLPTKDRYLFHDVNSADSLLIDSPSDTYCRAYGDFLAQRVATMKKLCFETGMHFVELATDDNVISVISHLFHQRR